MNNTTMTESSRPARSREETRAPEKYLKPVVNIIEVEEGLKLLADLPGCSRESLDVNVEKGILTISGQAKSDMPGRQLYTEFELAPYYRQFQIPESLDHEKAVASLTNGVLTLRVPKAEAAKPRRIEIRVAG